MAYSTEMMRIMVSELYADIDRNFRDPLHDYSSCEPTPKYDHAKWEAGTMKQGLFESILYEGVKVPIWAALLTEDEAKKASEKAGRPVKYRVIRGHRRYVAVEKVNEVYPGKILEVPCIVYTGLSVPEEWALMADHGGPNKEEGLSELGQYRACINLHGTAQFSQDMIGRMLGETRGWAMRRIWIHDMGSKTPIETEFLKRFDDKLKPGDYYSFTYKDVEDLHKLYNSDEKEGRHPWKDENSDFRRGFARFAATGEAKPTEQKSLTRQKLDERDSFVAGRPALEEMLKFASNRGGNVADAAKMYDKIHAKAEERDALASELEAANAKIVSLESELASAMTRIGELTAEITALKAEKTAKSDSKPTQPSGQTRKGR